MAGGQPIWIDDYNVPLPIYHPNQSPPKTSEEWYPRLMQGNCFNVGQVMRSSMIRDLGWYDPVRTPTAAEDLDMHLRMSEKYKMHMFEEPGLYVRCRSTTHPTISDLVDEHQAQILRVYEAAVERAKNRV
jgi:hypothetical protein